ncbi:MAG: DUF1801 domain-containing protein [Flammeovirgaceae bacterium]|nr:DUF1801 domain-containing protein [Flammeovirgaceae bacterium]
MAELKTKKNKLSVTKFLNSIVDEQKRIDSFEILDMMMKATKSEPSMWGASIIGFGSYRYKYESGREGDWPLTGFSPRKQNLTIYIMSGFSKSGDLLKKLGKCKTSVSCLYIKRLSDVDKKVLNQIIKKSVVSLSKK